MEFQAVVLAAGRGTRITDLTSTTPKALLPVANIPMIWYPVNMLEKAGFTEAIVIVLENEKNDIQRALIECDVQMELQFVTIPDEEDWGTADSLRHIADRIHLDIVLVSCDLITNLSLNLLADVHRTNDATVTMLLARCTDITDMSVPGGKANRKIERDIAGLDEKGDHVLFMSSEADLEETISFKKSFFKRHPYVNMIPNLIDSHLYLVKRSVFDILKQKRNLSAFKGEVIPYLVKKQNSRSIQEKDANLSDPKSVRDRLMDLEKDDVFLELMNEMTTYSSSSSTTQSGIKCYCYMMKSGFCLRANTLLTYCEANRQTPKQLTDLAMERNPSLVHPKAVISEKTQTGQDSMVGECTTIGEKCGVKKSVIGKFCKIGDKVKISNCVIMDHVTIEEGCVISGSIICSNATICQRCELKDCLVGGSQHIKTTGNFTNEVFAEGKKMMEI